MYIDINRGFESSKMRGQSDNKTFRIHLKYTEIVPTLSWDALALAKYFRSFSRLKSIKNALKRFILAQI